MAKRNINADWKQWYKDHLITVEEAVDKVEDGDVIFVGQASTSPAGFLDALYARYKEFKDVVIITNVSSAPLNMLFDPDIKGHLIIKSIYNLPLDRMGIDEYTVQPIGTGYDQYEYALWANDCNTIANCFCPPDEDGYMNCACYGVATNVTIGPDPRLTKKFAFVDKTGVFPAPGTHEEVFVHVTDFDYIIEADTEMFALDMPEPTEFDEKIASFILPYIKEGDKIQIGYGGLGSIIMEKLNAFDGKFEIFTEVFCDTMIPMMESGKITKLTACAPSACAQDSMEWLVNTELDAVLNNRMKNIDPLGIMEQDNIVAINATFQIDLLGQCCSEAQGLKPYTGVGGSFAYIYGTQRTKGGRSFICLRSTYKKDGELLSNVHPWLPEGCIVSMVKNYVMFLVTEYGVADVYLKTYVERIRQIIKIAHPDFREELKAKIVTTPLIEERDFEGYDMFDGKQPEPRQPVTCMPFRQYTFHIRDDMQY